MRWGHDSVASAAAESMQRFTGSLCLTPASMSATDHVPFKAVTLMQARRGRWVYLTGDASPDR